MEPVALATVAVAFLSPYLVKAGEKLPKPLARNCLKRSARSGMPL
jgi:hypothetical protein